MKVSTWQAQRGMALLICLILLLLMTIVGLAGMQNAILQEKMAGNAKLKNESFQLAESSLRAGEVFVGLPANSAALLACVTCSGATCAVPDFSAPAAQGGTCNVWKAYGDGFYMIQKLGTTTAATNVQSGQSVTLFRITAVGSVGRSKTALESIYAKN